MAPILSTVEFHHVEGVTDSQRERELYKYYKPAAPPSSDASISSQSDSGPATEDAKAPRMPNITSTVASTKISSPDTALTAFCQLVTWRTGAERAMISLIDASTQYFIAESTKTVDLEDNTQHAPGDDLWIGCSSVSKAGRLCERTIEVAPKEGYPCFTVNDLCKDERFSDLPFVTGSPYLRFYAGVPLITNRGIAIGSLFIVDSRPKPNLHPDEVHFLGTMAKTIMNHLEMVRGVEEHRRGMKMSRGLASFVEGRSQLAEAEVEVDTTEGTKIAGSFGTETEAAQSSSKSGSVSSTRVSVSSIDRKEKEYSTALAKTEETMLESRQRSESQSSRPVMKEDSAPNSFTGTNISQDSPSVREAAQGEDLSEASTMKVLFSRAANLMREAFEVDGGAVFFDAQRGFGGFQSQLKPGSDTRPKQEESHTSDDFSSSEMLDGQGEEEENFKQESPGASEGRVGPGLGEGIFSRSAKSSHETEKAAEVLGFSTAGASSINGDNYPGSHSFVRFDETALHKLLRRYPRGKLWTFDSDGAVSSSSEEDSLNLSSKHLASKDFHRRRMRSLRARSDAKFLAMHFPGVRQLLFVPLWDEGRSRWLSGCFIWSTEGTRVLTRMSELAFLTAFCNSVMAECSRIETEIADQKKSDFIGSISHELRSPLHGILASAEFLGEEVLTAFEKGLVETIDSCGRTLLDTINHILDYSKINHFEKNWKKTKRSGRPVASSSDSRGAGSSDLPMINLFAEVDVSVVCEEVIEGVFAGHVFQNVTAQSFDMVPDARGKMSDNTMTAPDKLANAEVAVILDVNMQNYRFTTQPGAFRRVIMNLLGNALKYTSHGYVRINLEATEMEDLHLPGSTDSNPRSMVTITVSDTGRGISSEFLRTKLFTPFAQENSLSSGTGLGLSIVKSIIHLLEGNLVIESELGRGTQVRVAIPLLKDMPKSSDSNTSSTPRSGSSIPREADDSISSLRARVVGRKVSLHGFDLDTKDPILHRTGQLLQASVTNFLTNWYGLKIVPFGQRAAIVVLNEATPAAVAKVVQQSASHGKTPAILVLCSHSSRTQRSSNSDYSANVGFVAKPVGPLKLARALTQCLEEAPSAITPGLFEGSSPESNDLSTIFEELSSSPHTGELLDNSRMAADSDNARKAIESPTPTSLEKYQEFPFPVPDRPQASKSKSMPGDKEGLKPLGKDTIPGASSVLSKMEATSSSTIQSQAITSMTTQPSFSTMRSPRLLLVDDNVINLGLLRAFMKKRKYDFVELAENGLQAVQKFEQKADGFDIIFMDISMPVLNGFDATKQIRSIENSRNHKSQSNVSGSKSTVKVPSSALIIALTGLASSHDQAEAASVGIDVFLTKPVSFKEVGKMMDNWQANRERDSRGSGSS